MRISVLDIDGAIALCVREDDSGKDKVNQALEVANDAPPLVARVDIQAVELRRGLIDIVLLGT